MSLWQRFLRNAPYHAHFLASINHAWLLLATVGIGIGIATAFSVAAGLALYGLGVIFLPSLPRFRNGYDAGRRAENDTRQKVEALAKDRVREKLLRKLSAPSKQRWQNFSAICEDLQSRLGEAEGDSLMPDRSLAKVGDSHLLLLAMDADIRDYLATAEPAASLAKRMGELQAALDQLHPRTDLSDVEQRLVLSKEETLKNLRQQADQIHRMQLNLDLAQSELERLESQISFLKAELISTPAGQLSSRMGETLVQVEASQRVLQEGGMVNAPDLTALLGERA